MFDGGGTWLPTLSMGQQWVLAVTGNAVFGKLALPNYRGKKYSFSPLRMWTACDKWANSPPGHSQV